MFILINIYINILYIIVNLDSTTINHKTAWILNKFVLKLINTIDKINLNILKILILIIF